MSDSLEARPTSTDQETVQQVCLGDGSSDNQLLTKSIKKLAEKVGSHTDDKSKILSLLKSVGGYIWWPAAIAVSPLKWAIEVFTGHEEKIIRAKADAKKVEAEADKIHAQASVEAELLLVKGKADAEKTRAEAEKLLAEADKVNAEAEGLRAQIAKLVAEAAKKNAEAAKIQDSVGQADELEKLLKILGVQWAGTVNEKGILQIIVVKEHMPELPPCDDDDLPKELP